MNRLKPSRTFPLLSKTRHSQDASLETSVAGRIGLQETLACLPGLPNLYGREFSLSYNIQGVQLVQQKTAAHSPARILHVPQIQHERHKSDGHGTEH